MVKTKKNLKRKSADSESNSVVKKKKQEYSKPKADIPSATILPPVRFSDAPVQRKPQWINRERVLIICTRGVSYITRHIIKDLMNCLPHSKSDSKFDDKHDLSSLVEIAELKNCSKIMFFEARKRKDLYLWLGCMPNGPSAKFLVENIRTSAELKMTGNALKSSRPILSFDPSFDDESLPHLNLLREMLIQILGTPNQHPKSQPYFDKTFSFTNLKNRIWFRNFQIVEESGALSEIGPRFSLNPIKIFSGNFKGSVIWENPDYVSPNVIRRMFQTSKRGRYVKNVQARMAFKCRDEKRATNFNPIDPTDDVYE